MFNIEIFRNLEEGMNNQKQPKNIGPEGYLETDKQHKDWYNRREMGKQKGKPRYAPPKEKKSGKTWREK